jgi:YidC/Oxa1 family membrane protein insertase
LFDLIATVLSWFYDLWPSYGVSIVLLTVAVMLLVTPLTLKGTRSMLELQAHQPELRRIQTQFKNDRQKMNEELMKFYGEHKINPLGGCLPLLIQLPVFFVLYRVIHALTSRVSLVEAIASGHPDRAGHFDPGYLDHSSAMFRALQSHSEMVSWGIDLSRTPLDAISDGFGTALPYVLLIAVATAASYYQQAQIQRRATGPANPQMQMITKIMPLFITFISLSLPAALVVYFCVSGAYRIGQQAIITRHIYTDEVKERLAAARATSTIDTTGSEAGTPGGFLGRLLSPPPNGAAAGSQKPAKKPSARSGGAGTKADSKSDTTTANGSASPTPPKATGRITPPGARPAAARKRKKRK